MCRGVARVEHVVWIRQSVGQSQQAAKLQFKFKKLIDIIWYIC